MRKYLFSLLFLCLLFVPIPESEAQEFQFPITHTVNWEGFAPTTENNVTAYFSNPVPINPFYNYITVNTDLGHIEITTEKGRSFYTANEFTMTGSVVSYFEPGHTMLWNIGESWLTRTNNQQIEGFLIHQKHEATNQPQGTGNRRQSIPSLGKD